MESERDDDWECLVKLGLCQGLDSIEEYTRRAMKGQALAAWKALIDPQKIPSVEYIQQIHHVMFQEIHPWAGTFNQLDDPDVKFGKMRGCDPAFILPELKQLERDTEELLNRDTVESSVEAIAFFHLKFERIHPFSDGNGRVGRVLIASQMHAIFGPKPRKSIKGDSYYRAIHHAHHRNDLRPLINLVLALESLPPSPRESIPLPFRLRLRQGTPNDKKLRRQRVLLAIPKGLR